MDLGAVLDIVIGLCFAYFLLALFCSWANEAVAVLLNRRGDYLFVGLREMLQDPKMLSRFVQHPLVESLDKVRTNARLLTRARVNKNASHGLRRLIFPSYLPTGTFSTVLLDLISPPGGAKLFATAHAAIGALPDAKLRGALQAIADRADNDIEALRKGIEDWYGNTMDRVSGWYKNYTQLWLLVFGMFFAVAFNVDTFKIVRELWANPAARAMAVQAASSVATSEDIKKALKEIEEAKSSGLKIALQEKLIAKVEIPKQFGEAFASARGSVLPVGWGPDQQAALKACFSRKWADCWKPTEGRWFEVFLKLLGFFVTACAVALGAPFWFELMNKLIDLRGAGRRPDGKK